jgi:hypothetical protein
MPAVAKDLIGKAGDTTTQGLGRLVSQYASSPKLIGLLQGLYELGQDMDLLWRKIQRLLNPHDDVNAAPGDPAVDAGTVGSGDTGPTGTICVQLDIIGRIVGISRVLPNKTVMTNTLYLSLILARITRNHVQGATIPELVNMLVSILDPTATGSPDISVVEIGYMTILVEVDRELTADEMSIFAISSGVNFVPGGLLPRQTGVYLATYWRDTGCFTFATEDDTTVLEDPAGEGFNTTESATVGVGRWAEDF